MEADKKYITVEALIHAPVAKVWAYWTEPEHIKQWTFASDEWHAPLAENDLRVGGKFKTTMAAKDGSFGFDFEGTYTDVVTNSLIAYVLGDERTVEIKFGEAEGQTKVVETFVAETQNPIEMQQGGWQAILNNFKKHVESE
jgi:uncharacterized protein YndB with AHSA1/START domain